jgi:hypothetical protein
VFPFFLGSVIASRLGAAAGRFGARRLPRGALLASKRPSFGPNWEPDNTPAQPPAKPITATPFTVRDPASLPVRDILYGRHLVRGFVAGLVGIGGGGKSTLTMAENKRNAAQPRCVRLSAVLRRVESKNLFHLRNKKTVFKRIHNCSS